MYHLISEEAIEFEFKVIFQNKQVSFTLKGYMQGRKQFGMELKLPVIGRSTHQVRNTDSRTSITDHSSI